MVGVLSSSCRSLHRLSLILDGLWLFSHVQLFATSWTVAHQAPLSSTISQSWLDSLLIIVIVFPGLWSYSFFFFFFFLFFFCFQSHLPMLFLKFLVTCSSSQPLFFFLAAACKILVTWPGIKPGPLPQRCQVLTTRLPGNSLSFFSEN